VKPLDVVRFAWGSLRGYPGRTVLMGTAMAIGVGAVVVLTALGEGARGYVVNQFSSLGTNLLIVFPGRTETGGAAPGMFVGQTPRDLTLEDALALARSPLVARVAPLTVGSALVSYGGRSREAPVLGTTADWLAIRHMEMATGHFLPAGDPRAAASVCVVGAKVRDELFGAENAVGKWLRIGDRRYRVVGVIASGGVNLGFNTDELVMVPVASAQALFNIQSLLRVLVEARTRSEIEAAKRHTEEVLRTRHEGELDVTVVTQDAVLTSFNRILALLTAALAGIAAISLSVAGIGIMNVMIVSVSERTREIGLLKAVGVTAPQVLLAFLVEAALLSSVGGLVGVTVGIGGTRLVQALYPSFPMEPPPWAVPAAVVVSMSVGLVFGALPARRAARLDPVAALAGR
jgi:putative ABC transport system permease protein